jgi:hypothetical protein
VRRVVSIRASSKKSIMTERTSSAAIAIVPCNDIASAERWWNRLGFTRPSGADGGDYRILSDGHAGRSQNIVSGFRCKSIATGVSPWP